MKNQVFHMILPTDNVGFKIVELANWVGKVFIVPRAHLKDLKERKEAKDPAIYFLFGEEDESTGQPLYIGETESFLSRLATHDLTKDFWNTAIIFTGGLDKGKVRFIESLASTEAKFIDRFAVINDTSPKLNNLSESDEISTRDYFEKIKYALSVLGYPVFDDIAHTSNNAPEYILKIDGTDVQARILSDASVIVLRGSKARIKETPSFGGWAQAARKRFLDDGTFKDAGDGVSYTYTQDVFFKSPSAAAAASSGRPINGWTSWKDKRGKTLDENLRSSK